MSTTAIPALASSTVSTAVATPDYLVGELRIQTLQGFWFFHASKDITITEIRQTFDDMLLEVSKALSLAGIMMAGSMIARYLALPGETKKFRLEIGYPVAAEPRQAGDEWISYVKPFRCASIIYCGSFANLIRGYEALEAKMKQAGLQTNGESREYYYYLENGQSPNNVIHLQHRLSNHIH